ncbi:MAG TPA: hypothetical protein VK110_05535 [Salinisphaeraceae bacterium]|nr:hypothetical protein [Salinisphaeraceae bacterium]
MNPETEVLMKFQSGGAYHDVFNERNRKRIEELREWAEETHRVRGLFRWNAYRYGVLREAWLELQKQFAAKRGWRVAGRPFSTAQLLEGRHNRNDADYCGISGLPYMDHCEYYRLPQRPYRPAAIVTHSYSTPGDIRAYANSNGFCCEFLPWSWYCPGETVAAVITAKNSATGREVRND